MKTVLLVLPCVAAFGIPSASRFGWSGTSPSSRAAVCVQEGATAPRDDAVAANAAAMAQQMEGITQQDGMSQKIVSKETYGLMLSTLLKTEEDLAAQISANYAMIDYAFLQQLDQAIVEEHDETKERLGHIKEAVNVEMAKRMQSAAEAMKDLVTSPTAIVMEGKIAGMARQGRLDDALLQLLEANVQQARAAGEAGKAAVGVLSKLQGRVQTELDVKLPKEVALLRRLLRMDDPYARQALLREKMSPKKGTSGVLLSTLDKAEQDAAKDTEPDVSPRTMAEAIKDIKLRFGNVDENYDTGFVARLEEIADEAEAIALDLAGGKELTSKQAQDMAWEQATVSVWDLSQIEEEAHAEGNFAMWEEEAQAQMARQDSAMRKSAIDGDWSK